MKNNKKKFFLIRYKISKYIYIYMKKNYIKQNKKINFI